MARKTKLEPKIKYTASKSDIWNAYKQHLEELESGAPTATHQITATTQNLKTKLSAKVQDMALNLQQEVDQIVNLINQANQVIQELQDQQSKLKRQFDQENQDAQLAREREEEEYSYQLEQTRKHQQQELNDQKQQAQAEIAKQKEELKLAADELKDLRTLAAGFDKRLEEAVKEAVNQTQKDLTLQFEHDQTLKEQQARGQIELLSQKITSLENVITSQQTEIKNLQASLKEASSQLTRIAEKAVSQTTRSNLNPAATAA